MKGLYVLFMLVIASHSVCSRITLNTGSTFDVLTYGAIGDGQTDDSNAFLKAFNDTCGTTEGTPTMTIPEGKTFLLQPLVFKGPCKSTTIIVELKGNITAPKDIDSWKFPAEKERKIWIQFSKISGLIVNGEGNIDGQGSPWWDKFGGKGQEKFRPTALRFLDCEALVLSDLTHMNSPKNHISIDSCKNASISNLHITAPSTSPNTDGFDISESTNIVIMNSTIETGDDCIAINNGSSVITITGIFCGPGHGISVGSLGKDNSYATVENIRVQNCTFNGTSNGGRIKTFVGGSGYARNITYEDIILNEVKNPVIIDQQYNPNADSNVEISSVTYSNVRGTSVGEYAIELKCEPNIGCTNILLDHINITRVDGKQAAVICVGGHGNFSSCNPVVSCLNNTSAPIWY